MNDLILVSIVFSVAISMATPHVINGYIQVTDTGSQIKFERALSKQDINNSVNFAIDTINRLKRLEQNLRRSNLTIRENTSEHLNFLQNLPDISVVTGKEAYVASYASTHLKHKHCRRLGLTNEECQEFLKTLDPHTTQICSNPEISAKYRTLDGSCNHLKDTTKGRCKSGYKRILKPVYLDGIQRIRNSVTRAHLPSARTISSKLFRNLDDIDERNTLSLMAWTEFVLHDLSHTVTRKMVHFNQTITCCGPDGFKLAPRHEHPFCLPITVPTDDEFYSKFDVRCLSYVRSLPAAKANWMFGAIDQLNQATHYLDGSQIYGHDYNTSKALRTFKDGLLKFQVVNNEVFWPYSKKRGACVNNKCYKGGDHRLNSHPLITTLYTIFLREHNRIATSLKATNPHWGDPRLFEESRKIVIAELQHVTYKEWLPIVLGEKYKKIILRHTSYEFKESIDPTISNSFATAAMKFYSSLYDAHINSYGENREVNLTLNLKDIFGHSSLIEGYFDGFLRGLSTQNSQKVDLNVPDDVRNHLFAIGNFGLDIISLDVQRGRDHGLPSYTAYLKSCDLIEEVEDFNDLIPIIPESTVETISKLYSDVNDIDVLIGGLSETPLEGGILGPTFSCIITDQFLRTKHGDRYFYTHRSQRGSFTNKQLKEIEKITLASIFCANGNIQTLQRNVFHTIDDRNHLQGCNQTPQINLNHWREKLRNPR